MIEEQARNDAIMPLFNGESFNFVEACSSDKSVRSQLENSTELNEKIPIPNRLPQDEKNEKFKKIDKRLLKIIVPISLLDEKIKRKSKIKVFPDMIVEKVSCFNYIRISEGRKSIPTNKVRRQLSLK
jgi:hypothetical protein